MSERHLTATQRRRTQRREGPPQMRLALWALEPEARRGLRAKPTEDGMGSWPCSFETLVGAPWECG